eukprot:scaffold44971_cov47-Attheya_sp.AAC.2
MVPSFTFFFFFPPRFNPNSVLLLPRSNTTTPSSTRHDNLFVMDEDGITGQNADTPAFKDPRRRRHIPANDHPIATRGERPDTMLDWMTIIIRVVIFTAFHSFSTVVDFASQGRRSYRVIG